MNNQPNTTIKLKVNDKAKKEKSARDTAAIIVQATFNKAVFFP